MCKQQMNCVATTRHYNHKAARAKMTQSEINEIQQVVYHQFTQAMKEQPITCAGTECKRKRILLHMYRCWFCGRYFCPRCARMHFGDRD